MDPKNPRVLFAGMWQHEIHTWGRESGGPGSGLFMSRDGGVTWKKLTGHGLPAKPVGKVAVAIAASNPNRIYALIETGDGVPWKGQPTGQQTQVQKVLEEQLRNTLSQRDGLLSKELGGFNDMLRKKNVPNIVAKTP